MTYLLDQDANVQNSLITRKLCSSSQNKLYFILNYTNMGILYDDYNTSKYRSVVYSFPEKQLLCFSPPKTIPFSVFRNMYPIITFPFIKVSESMEGVMINLFFDKRINKWEIATKNAIGGKYWFYGSEYKKRKTFYTMFLEAFRSPLVDDINDIIFFENLPKSLSYTFILQHQENKILLPIDRARVFLVGVYNISETVAEYIPSEIGSKAFETFSEC